MAKTVVSAFNEFQTNIVNLESKQTKKARTSRDWLVGQINSLPLGDSDFPKIYTEKSIYFGSFARKTKINPLDDIDIMICLKALGSTYNSSLIEGIEITVNENVKPLRDLCFENTIVLNSRKVVNKFVSKLNNIPNYEKAEIKRNQEAAVLNLISYDWKFDIVPCFFTNPELDNRTYYLIPDGHGNWKKTDPVIDRDRVQKINQSRGGIILNLIRLIKYWNKRQTMPSVSSYLLETMVLDFVENFTFGNFNNNYYHIFTNILDYIHVNIFNSVYDPKGIQGNINDLSREEQEKISKKAIEGFQKGQKAISFENSRDVKNSISQWSEIFGDEFPSFD